MDTEEHICGAFDWYPNPPVADIYVDVFTPFLESVPMGRCDDNELGSILDDAIAKGLVKEDAVVVPEAAAPAPAAGAAAAGATAGAPVSGPATDGRAARQRNGPSSCSASHCWKYARAALSHIHN